MKKTAIALAVLGTIILGGCATVNDKNYTAYALAQKAASETQTACMTALGEAAKAGNNGAVVALAVGSCGKGTQVALPQQEGSTAIQWAGVLLQAFGIHTQGRVSINLNDNQTKQALSNDQVLTILGTKDPVVVQPATPIVVTQPAPVIVEQPEPIIVQPAEPIIVTPADPIVIQPSYPPVTPVAPVVADLVPASVVW